MIANSRYFSELGDQFIPWRIDKDILKVRLNDNWWACEYLIDFHRRQV